MAPPKKPAQLTPQQIEQLAMLGLADEDIALVAGISERTLQRRYGAQLKAGRVQQRQKLLALLWQRAPHSDRVAIWLSQQWLGMRPTAPRADEAGVVTVRVLNDDRNLDPRTD